MYNHLRQPFPYDPSTSHHVGVAGFFGIFIFAFLVLFKPFDLDKYDISRVVIISFFYGLVTFTCIILCSYLFPRLFPNFFNESRWTTGRQIFLMLLIIFIVGLGNYLVSPLLVDSQLNLYYAVWFQGITLAVAVLPICLYFLIKQNRLLKKFSEEARQIEKKLLEKLKEQDKGVKKNTEILKILLTGDNQKEKLELYADDLHLVSAASNYIKIFHIKKDKLVYSILRSTLKKTEESLGAHSPFYKCHRAYIINLDKVVHVEGNAQGYKVKIQGHDELIPVSRNLNNEFSDKLLSFPVSDNVIS